MNCWQTRRGFAMSGTLLGAMFLFGSLPFQAVAADRVGPERCGECHKLEFRAWNESTHGTLLSDSESNEVLEKSEEISEALGIDDIETDASCVGCHFSSYIDDAQEEQLTSVDCESCHGAASGWVDLHGDYGPTGDRAEDEDPTHKTKRLADAKASGMLNPAEIVSVTSNCLGCHTGPGEQIVNVGGHTPGSNFELVSWLSGEVRHNFHRTGQGANAQITAERRRQLYVVGRALELEYALRGLASATKTGIYREAMVGRINDAKGHLEKVKAKQALTQIDAMLSALASVNLAAGNEGAANAAADRVHRAAVEFAAAHDGAALGSIDPLIPKTEKGSAYTGD